MGNNTSNSLNPHQIVGGGDSLTALPDGLAHQRKSNESHITNASARRRHRLKHGKAPQAASVAASCMSEHVRIYKNVLIISLAFFLLFSAFQGLTNLQTSIHANHGPVIPALKSADNRESGNRLDRMLEKRSNEGLAAYSMTTLYIGLVVSAIFLPQIVIDLLTLKWAIVLCIFLYLSYIFANLHPTWFTLIPGAICAGLAAGVLWTAQCTYVAEMGRKLANYRAKRELPYSLSHKSSNSVPPVLTNAPRENYLMTPLNPASRVSVTISNPGSPIPINYNSATTNNKPSSPSQRDSSIYSYNDITTVEDFRTGQIPYANINNESVSDLEDTQDVGDDNGSVNASRRDVSQSVAKRQAQAIKKRRVHELSEKTIPHLLGIFFFFFQGGQIFGNIISSLTLSGPENMFTLPHSNTNSMAHYKTGPGMRNTMLQDQQRSSGHCGGRFCLNFKPGHNFGHIGGISYTNNPRLPNTLTHGRYSGGYGGRSTYGIVRPNPTPVSFTIHKTEAQVLDSKINMLCYIYAMMCMFAGLAVALFLDPVSLPPTCVREDLTVPGSHNASFTNGASDRQQKGQLLSETRSPINLSPEIGTKGMNFNYQAARLQNFKQRAVTKLEGRAKYWYQISSTFRQMRNRFQLLLIPLTMYMGLQQGFIAADFTLAFVSCYYGIRFIGLVMSFYGLVNAFCAICGGSLNSLVPRWIIFALIFVIHGCISLPFLSFFPRFGDRFGNLLLAAAIWAIGDGLLQPQLNGLYGTLFKKSKETSAYANCRLWEAVGFIIGFSLHEKLCLRSKSLIMGTLLTCGIICYALIEYIISKRKQRLRQSKLSY